MTSFSVLPSYDAVALTDPGAKTVGLCESHKDQDTVENEQGSNAVVTIERKSSVLVSKHFFSFLELPTELRLETYDFVLTNHRGVVESVNIRTFKMPALALVNKQVLEEMLPLIFKKTKYHANIDSNLVDRYRKRNQLRLANTWDSSIKICGLLRPTLKNLKTILALSNEALFMDITLNIVSTEHGFKHRKVTKADEIVTIIELPVAGDELKVSVKTGEYHPDNGARVARGFNGAFEKVDVDATVSAIRDVAVKIGQREEFGGLTLEDLIEIGKPTRHAVDSKR